MYIHCIKCDKDIDSNDIENAVEVVNVESDFYGRDLITFRCKECGSRQQSHVHVER
jgi:DNA-directed RNA polymerase subunit RPC12/RpoP